MMEQETALFKRQKKLVIYISIVVFLLDLVFIILNYHTSKKALDDTILATSQAHESEFNLTLTMTYRNMMQLGLYISENSEINQLFLEGKKAVLAEGGAAGGIKANEKRQALLEKVKPAWDKLTENYNIRQLHYHLGPGSLSYLRVHKPNKYGDRMDDVRHIIVDTNAEKTPRYGFETGRIYSGLRGVYPIWATDPETGKKVYVGALETGTSFQQILPVFARSFNTEIAIFLTKNHVISTMWHEFINDYFDKNPNDQYYLESTSSNAIKSILPEITINDHFQSKKIDVIYQDSKYWALYYFPFKDYQASKEETAKAIGFVITWMDITDLIVHFRMSILLNILFAIIALIIIEFALIWFLKRQKRLIIAERKAMFDGLTGIYNRGFFNQALRKMIHAKDQLTLPISCLMCDIDYFKNYNDTYGHQKGDRCLKQVAASLKAHLRGKEDLLARYGGEEFIILLPNTTLNDAKAIAERMRQTVYDLKIEHQSSETSKYVTLSIGVSSTDDPDGLKELLVEADENLYKAKRNGRNQIFGE